MTILCKWFLDLKITRHNSGFVGTVKAVNLGGINKDFYHAIQFN